VDSEPVQVSATLYTVILCLPMCALTCIFIHPYILYAIRAHDAFIYGVYCSWGGEIELGILSQHFDAELCVVSMEPLYLLPFPGSKAKHYLLYTGQHYDPLVGAATTETSVDDEVYILIEKDKRLVFCVHRQLFLYPHPFIQILACLIRSTIDRTCCAMWFGL